MLLPQWSALSLDAFAAVLARKPVLTWLGNSVAVTAGATVLSLAIATLAGYSLSRFKSRAQQVASFALLASKMLPASLIVIPFFIGFSTFGLIDTRGGLILANAAVGVPFATWLMKGFFDGIPREIELAALLDGCNGVQAVWHVVLPLARPGLAACAMYRRLCAGRTSSLPGRWSAIPTCGPSPSACSRSSANTLSTGRA